MKFNTNRKPFVIKEPKKNSIIKSIDINRSGAEREVSFTEYISAKYGDGMYYSGFDIYDAFENKLLTLGHRGDIMGYHIDKNNNLYHIESTYHKTSKHVFTEREHMDFKNEFDEEYDRSLVSHYLSFKYLLYPKNLKKEYYELNIKANLGIDLDKKILTLKEWQEAKKQYEKILKEQNP